MPLRSKFGCKVTHFSEEKRIFFLFFYYSMSNTLKNRSKNPTNSPFPLVIIPWDWPLGIPVGWRKPSYKAKRSLKYPKANFHI